MPRPLALLLCALALLTGGAHAQDPYSGKTFRITGTWTGTQLEAQRVQLRELSQDVRRVQISGRVDMVDTAGHSFNVGPLRIEWNDKTKFESLNAADIKPGAVLRVSGRSEQAGRWLASSIRRESGSWPKDQLQVTATAAPQREPAAAAGANTEISRLDMSGVPVRLRGAGYNRVDSLTQRQDSRRPDEPFRLNLAGRPLIITGAYTASYRERKNFELDDESRSDFDQEATVELFYPYRDDLFFFGELQGFYERELRRTDGDDLASVSGVERGQMWVFFDGLAQRRVGVQLGRQNFKETREWWWDDDLDAARLYYDRGPLHVEFGLARELARESTADDDIDPVHKGVTRAIGQASWLWASRQAIELYALHQNDGSKRDAVGSTVAEDAEDASDAKLTWLGVRAIGQRPTDKAGEFRYWADFGVVRGRETTYDFDDAGGGRSRVEERENRDVRGHAFDLGVSWQLPVKWEPAVTLAYARGSGDDGEGGADTSFRQTGLHNNKARFFGVNRFRYYGELLRPELSNLGISTVAFGVPFFQRSSVEIVYHRYRQVKAADFLRDFSVDEDLTGASRDIGSEVDVVFGFRDLARWDFSLIASRFKAGKAYGEGSGKNAHLWFLEATYNF